MLQAQALGSAWSCMRPGAGVGAKQPAGAFLAGAGLAFMYSCAFETMEMYDFLVVSLAAVL